MTHQHAQPDPNASRIDELLVDRAALGLSDAEAIELRRLLDAAGKAEDDSLDLAAAALDRAMHPADIHTELPLRLLADLDHDGAAWCAGVKAGDSVAGRIGVRTHGREERGIRTPLVMGKRYLRDWSGWMAAAACLGFGIYVWNNRTNTVNPGTSQPNEAGIIGSNLVESLRVKALNRIDDWFNSGGSDVQVVSIGAAKPEASSKDVSLGEVYWNKCTRNGVLRITGLPPSKPDQVYQLWVYDRTRDNRYPVEGGRLKVEEGHTKVVIPLDPRMPIDDATLFAVTIEPERGTVVSQGDTLVGVGVPQGTAPPPVFDIEKKKK